MSYSAIELVSAGASGYRAGDLHGHAAGADRREATAESEMVTPVQPGHDLSCNAAIAIAGWVLVGLAG